MKRSLIPWLAGLAIASGAALAQPVTLDVKFRLTDLEYKALAGVPVRVVFGSDPDWIAPNTGQRFVTDANGEHQFSTQVVLDRRSRRRPTNFVDSLTARNEPVDHLLVAAELGYFEYQWLYAVDIHRFPGGDVLTEGFDVYSRDAQGRFTVRARRENGGWFLPELKGLMLTKPGHEPWNTMLQPDPGDPSGKRWTLQLAFKRSPPPIRR